MVVRSDVGGATACPTTDTDGARGPSSALHANSHGSSTAARQRRDREANRVAMTDVQAFVNCMCAYLRLSHAATLVPRSGATRRPGGTVRPSGSAGASITARAPQMNDGSSAGLILPTATDAAAARGSDSGASERP